MGGRIESMRVLIVEDEPYLAEAIRDGLRLQAIAADIAGDGDTALELLSINAYDIAVLDRDIPGPSGDEIAKRIKDKDATSAGQTAASIIMEEHIKPLLRELGIEFHQFFSEKSLHQTGVYKKVLEILRERGLVYEADGATWFATTVCLLSATCRSWRPAARCLCGWRDISGCVGDTRFVIAQAFPGSCGG